MKSSAELVAHWASYRWVRLGNLTLYASEPFLARLEQHYSVLLKELQN